MIVSMSGTPDSQQNFVYLKLIEDIMKRISTNSVDDVKKIIEDILLSLENKNTSESFKFDPDWFMFSLKVLLQLYENLLTKWHDRTVDLSLKPILQIVIAVTQDSNQEYNLSQHSQQHIPQIVNSLVKIASLQNHESSFLDLAEFYNQNLVFIKNNHMQESEGIRLNNSLKILSSIYKEMALMNKSLGEKVKKFVVTATCLNIKYDIEETDLLTDLVIHGPDDILASVLFLVLPDYTRSFEDKDIVTTLWRKMSKLMAQDMIVKQSKMLLILCHLFNFCFADTSFIDKGPVAKLIFQDVNFWKLTQMALSSRDSLTKKQGMYLFKQAIDLLSSDLNVQVSCRSSSQDSENVVLWWDDDHKAPMTALYRKLMTVLEYFDEQQVHIIKPMFGMIDELIEMTLSFNSDGGQFSYAWILLVYERALAHDGLQIVKWGLDGLFNLPECFYSHHETVESIARLLATALNNTAVYYNAEDTLSDKLRDFFKRVAAHEGGHTFFKLFIANVCELTWSPEALFYTIHALAQLGSQQFWQETEINRIKQFVSKVFQTHHKVIRAGIQFDFINAIISLTDTKSIHLDSIVTLMMTFSNLGSLQRGSVIWDRVVNWMRRSFLELEFEQFFEKLASDRPGDGKLLGFVILLSFDMYSTQSKFFDWEHISEYFSSDLLQRILLEFRHMDRRAYYDRDTYNNYTMIISQILDESLNYQNEKNILLKMIFPFLPDIVAFIEAELLRMTTLQDYHTIVGYLKTYENILKCQVLYKVRNDVAVKFIERIVMDLKTSRESLSSVRLYTWMQFLRVSHTVLQGQSGVDGQFLNEYVGAFANESLRKDEDLRGDPLTTDLVNLWGIMNSEFLESKWTLLDSYLKAEGLRQLTEEGDCRWSTLESLTGLCEEALSVGGYGILGPVMSVLKMILPLMSQGPRERALVDMLWKSVLERRKSEDFKFLMKKFVEMLYQSKLTVREDDVHEMLVSYANLIFADSSLGVVNIFVKHIQELGLRDNMTPLFCHVLARALIFGPVQRKDERLTQQVCSQVVGVDMCESRETNTSNEVRARAVQMLLTMNRTDPSHQKFAWDLVQKLFELEVDLNKNKVRYFGDSHVHRVKHRLMQALLLLEPMLGSNETADDYLTNWLYNSLTTQNSQPSIKYQQEWLLVRILTRNVLLLRNFWNYLHVATDIRTKGLCSLIVMSYHLGKMLPDADKPDWLDKAIPTIFPFCMEQQFEVRLYAQVVTKKFYDLARAQKLGVILHKYKMLEVFVDQSIQRAVKGNVGKNCAKLLDDFYLDVFHPGADYTLRTIFVDLPRLAKVGSDEWIPSRMFKHCGVDETNEHIQLENADGRLEKIECAKWTGDKSLTTGEMDEDTSATSYAIDNYQKKIIPWKSLVPSAEISSSGSDRSSGCKDGLIVVASLIDRIPNLGGLARTCEIFGASEYVVGSLKYVDDKQFTSLSVTAEKWIPVSEVRQENLLNYVLDMKKQGYTVVGAEQALYSKPLNAVSFPKKSLLLLGNEKEGIPPHLLPLLDLCVEIPQVGIIRSLNVHVSGALFIWEYAKQQCFHANSN